MRTFLILFVAILVAGCSHLSMVPNTLDSDAVIYVDRGGHQMLPIVKDVLTKRGYKVTVGTKHSSIRTINNESGDTDSVISESTIGRARYVVTVRERNQLFLPFPCTIHGMWWIKYDVSIADNQTGTEILNWSSRNCAGLAEWRFKSHLDKLEIKK